LRLKDEDKDKESSFKDKDKDLKISPRGSSRTRTFLEDNNTAVRQYDEIDMNLNLTGAKWQISHSSLSHCETMVLDISHAMVAYSILENVRGLELPRTRTRKRTRKLVIEDPRGQGLSSRTSTAGAGVGHRRGKNNSVP